MIRFINVSLMRGTKPLLESVDLTLNPGDKIGLIGANGAGKSSLFGMLRGELHADQGEIDFPATWRKRRRRLSAPPSITPSTATSTCAAWKRSWPAWRAKKRPRKTASPSAT